MIFSELIMISNQIRQNLARMSLTFMFSQGDHDYICTLYSCLEVNRVTKSQTVLTKIRIYAF